MKMQHLTQLSRMADMAGIDSQADVTGLWVPGEYCAIHQVDTPSAPRRKWPTLLPWLLEERLLTPVENNHLVMIGTNNGKLSVLSVAKTCMHDWLQQVESRGIQQLQPDYLALPWQDDSVTVAPRDLGEGPSVWLVRYGRDEGFAAAPHVALAMLQRLLKAMPERRLLACCRSAELPESLRALQPVMGEEVDWQAPPTSRLNLLSGEFKASAALVRRPRWLPTAAMLVLAVALCFLWLDSANGRLGKEVAAYQEAERDEFYRRFPGLQLQSGDVRATVEQMVSDRFLQREQLQSPVVAMLQELDRLIADCACQVNSLQLDVVGGQLQLAAPISTEAFGERPGLVLQAAPADEESQTLLVSPELLQ